MEKQFTGCRDTPPILRALTAVLALGACLPPAQAGNFGVSPIRLDFDRSARTGSVTVTNDDGQKPLRVQVDAMSWQQDDEGKDRYLPSQELTFLPRIMTVPPDEKRLLRAGIRVPAADREKAYRLFIQEMPEPGTEGGASAQVAVKVRFGIPVFVKPLKEEPRGEIEMIELVKGTLGVKVRNTGNVHFIIQSIQLKAGKAFAKEIAGWYLLSGAARLHSTAIPADVCETLRSIDAVVKTDRLELTRRLEVDPAGCR
ncbi:MAG: fimbrial biogenesis chaperone [Ramlibacter sp.]